MNITFFDFINTMLGSPALLTAAVLTLGVIFVNGWTDAPNAIVSCVCSGVLSMKKAVALAAVANFAGVFVMSIVNSSVAKNIFDIADFSGSQSPNAALCAALLSVIILAVVAWVFGIPTSESHAIIASLTGSAVACAASINMRVIAYTLAGLVLSVAGGFMLGYYILILIKKLSLRRSQLKGMQIVSAALMAFMHGAQDGQKFISILLVGISISGSSTAFSIPLWTVILCSVTMALGTAAGGGRIIRKVGQQMVKLDIEQGVSADIAGGISLLASTLMGLPVSTTHAKTSAVMGCGFSGGKTDKKTARQMLAAWVITFPACFAMGYLFTRLFAILF